MKIAATDYDGTFCDVKTKAIPEGNIQAVKKWQAEGHRFGIATGRGLSLISEAISHYDLKVDFLVCNNGANAADGEGNILYVEPIERAVMEKLFALIQAESREGMLMIFTAEKAYHVRPNPNIPPELVTEVSIEEALDLKNVTQISLMLETAEEAQKLSDEIEAKLPALRGNINRNYLDINPKNCTKAWGLEKLTSLDGWNEGELLVIGDDKNDLPMIHQFHGFTVANAKPEIQEAAAEVFPSVGDMLLAKL